MRSFTLVLLLGLAAAPSSAVRITLDGDADEAKKQGLDQVQGSPDEVDGEDTADATKSGFSMPAFDELSRARVTRLAKLGILKSTAEEVVKKYAADKRGITKDDWEENNIESKLKAFREVQGSKVKTNKGKIGFAHFVKIPMDIELTEEIVTDGTTPAAVNKKAIAKWLSTKPRKYWSRFSGATLAQAFMKVNKCSEFDGCDTWKKLLQFVQLDKDQDASLNFADLADHLPTDRSESKLHWDNVGVIEEVDLKTLKLPSKLRVSIFKLAGKETSGIFGSSVIDLEAWAKFKLDETVTEFIKRDQRPRVEGEMDDVSGDVRFHQVADIIPWPEIDGAHKAELDASNHIKLKIRGFETVISVPTCQEVSGRQNGLELSAKDIETWLKKEEQGMNNDWSFGVDSWKRAKRMSEDVLRWGDGSIPDTPKRPGYTNDRIQCPLGGEERDQWSDVAPRLAAFVHLDSDHDGVIDFRTAYPYIKAALDAAAEPQDD